MTYYPKSQIKENQYTNGGEFVIISTQKNYVGSYWSNSKGEFFTGKTPNSESNLQLEIASKIPALEKTKSRTPTIEPFPKNYFVVNDSYYRAKNQSIRDGKDAPRPPFQTLTKPTNKDIQNGFFNRYFVKKGNESIFIEISKNEYNKFKDKDSTVQWQLYTPIEIVWNIQGSKDQVYNGNKTNVGLAEQTQNLPGFTLFFRNKFAQYFNPTDIEEDLTTDGSEYVNRRTGKPYTGKYHIHPTKGAMVGAKHINTPHDHLDPITKSTPITGSSTPISGGSFGGGGGSY